MPQRFSLRRLVLALQAVFYAIFAAGTVVWTYISAAFLIVLQSGVSYEDRVPYFDRRELSMSAILLVPLTAFSSNSSRCKENYRLDEHLFRKLARLIRDEVKPTPKMPLYVQLAIYLDWIAHYPTIREQRERFKLSHESIETARDRVRTAVLRVVYPAYVQQATSIPDLTGHPKYSFFQGAYGCVDGSHFKIEVRTLEKENWRNRKQQITTNSVLVCSTDGELVFNYASFGAEGVGSDSQVLRHCCTKDLTCISGGFLIADAGYGLSSRLLTPYRGVRYHLKEFADSTLGRPRNREELYNLRHSTFRNQIERAIGVLKKRFRICREPLLQGRKDDIWSTFYTCVAVHNFIRIEKKTVDNPIEAEVILDEEASRPNATVREYVSNEEESYEHRTWRDQIAEAMWQSYQAVL